MANIQKLPTYKLRNGEYFQFMTDFKSLLDSLGAVTIHSEQSYAAFLEGLTRLDEELRVDQGSLLTEEITAYDLNRDDLWRAFDMRIDATLLCTIPAEVEAAKSLRRLFNLYGDPRRKTYDEETAALTNLCGDLAKAENAGLVSLCGLDNWLSRLNELNVQFKASQNARDTEKAFKNSGNVKLVRQELDPLYEEIVGRVNAMLSLSMQTPEIEVFIAEINQKIKNLESTLAAREAKFAANRAKENLN